jgi:hypothetical protein
MSNMKIVPLIAAAEAEQRDQLLLHLQETSYRLVAALDEKIQRLEARIAQLEKGLSPPLSG